MTLIAFLKAGRDLAKEACALVWRQGLVNFLHLWYLRGKMPYVLSTAEAGRDKRSGGGAYVNRCVVGGIVGCFVAVVIVDGAAGV